MSVLRFPEWQKSCEDAFLESDPEKLFQRVIVAETAIFHRIHRLTDPPGHIEVQAMDETLKRLQCLVADRFAPPDNKENRSNSTRKAGSNALEKSASPASEL